jgi:hypothetical protein
LTEEAREISFYFGLIHSSIDGGRKILRLQLNVLYS